MPYRVDITDVAYAEVAQAFAWLARRSAAAAERWRQGLFGVIDSLSELPERCPLAPEEEWFRGGLRQLMYGKRQHAYRVLFRVRGDVVLVLRVRRGAQALLTPDDLPPEV
jgi:plasmid stabilization system protein ParE